MLVVVECGGWPVLTVEHCNKVTSIYTQFLSSKTAVTELRGCSPLHRPTISQLSLSSQRTAYTLSHLRANIPNLSSPHSLRSSALFLGRHSWSVDTIIPLWCALRSDWLLPSLGYWYAAWPGRTGEQVSIIVLFTASRWIKINFIVLKTCILALVRFIRSNKASQPAATCSQ